MKIKVRKFPEIKAQEYGKARKLIESGDLLMCAGTGHISKVIRSVTLSEAEQIAQLASQLGIAIQPIVFRPIIN